jgi:hypothetical protein
LIVSEQNHERAKLEDPKYLKARKGTKRHKGTKIEENQIKSQSRKNHIILFAKPDYPIFPVQIESE